MNKPDSTTDRKDQDLDKPTEKEVSVKRADLQAMITTEVNRKVDAAVAFQIVTATEKTLIDAMEIGVAAIQTIRLSR